MAIFCLLSRPKRKKYLAGALGGEPILNCSGRVVDSRTDVEDFTFLNFFSLSEDFSSRRSLMVPSAFCFGTCSHMDPLLFTSSLKGIKSIEFYCRSSLFP